MAEDFVRSLGIAFLAHRLRRASEALVDSGGGFVERHGFAAPPRAASTLLLLKRERVLGVTEIAQNLGLSHPLIIKLLAELLRTGLVAEENDPADQRRRLIRLTPAGEAQVGRLEQLLEVIAGTFTELFAEAGIDVIGDLDRMEAALARRPLSERFEERLHSMEIA